MSVDRTILDEGRTECAPLVELFADDDFAARRIESVLTAGFTPRGAPGDRGGRRWRRLRSALESVLSPTVRAVLAGQTAVPAAARHELDQPALSGREKQVLGIVVTGLSNKAIAGQLFLAESTVKCHLSSAFSKLGVHSRNEAADVVLQSEHQFGLASSARPATYATTEGSEP